MLLTVADFVGDYRLHNTNNPNPDLLSAIDEAQATLANSLFSEGGQAIITNAPTAPPNVGLAALGLRSVFLPWCFLRVQLPVLAAGVNNLSDFPAQNVFPSGNFFKIAGAWQAFLKAFRKFEATQSGVAVAANTIRIPDDDPLWPQIVFSGGSVVVSGVGQASVVSVATVAGVGTDFTLTVSTLIVGQTYSLTQRAVVTIKKSFVYF